MTSHMVAPPPPAMIFNLKVTDMSRATFLIGYQHDGQIIYVIPRKPDELADLFECQRNTKWREIVKNNDHVAAWVLAVIVGDDNEVRRQWSYWTAKYQPICNRQGRVDQVQRGMLIVCTSGPYMGETKDSQAAWCKFLKSSAVQMSNHVNRRAGYNTVKGCTFSPLIKNGLYHPCSQEYIRRSQLPENADNPHYNGNDVQVW